MSVKRYSGERDSLFDVEYVLATDFDALAKRLEEAERDAARYRWLREYCVGGDYVSFVFKPRMGLDASLDAKMDENAVVHETEIEADARRYAWLVEHGPSGFPLGPYVVGCPQKTKLDAEIDAAMEPSSLKARP